MMFKRKIYNDEKLTTQKQKKSAYVYRITQLHVCNECANVVISFRRTLFEFHDGRYY